MMFMEEKSKYKAIIDSLPKEGFIKVTGKKPSKIKKEEKVALIRKGNELFNKGKYKLAQRIFLTTGYTDGLIRLGQYYYKNNQPLEALKMFWLAPYKKGIEAMASKLAGMISLWLREDKKG